MGDLIFIRNQIGSTLKALGAPNSALRLCDNDEAAAVVSKTKALFVSGDQNRWWWDSFSKNATRTGFVQNDNSTAHIFDFVEQKSKCWLIIDADVEIDFPHRFIVVDTDAQHAALILGDIAFVEYYLVDRNFQSLFAENHHGKLWFIDVNNPSQT